ncbi:MAG: hypothetical protein EOP49_32345 [Sphingobacteriales bacterium]|nr:MAG: hypothetical protein EOP49_32345 [Sphingobacteriales bacterium]
MKYHYQFASRTSVRIELIPEKETEVRLLNGFAPEGDIKALLELFGKGLKNYQQDAQLKETVFMKFPTVALIKFEPSKTAKPLQHQPVLPGQLKINF